MTSLPHPERSVITVLVLGAAVMGTVVVVAEHHRVVAVVAAAKVQRFPAIARVRAELVEVRGRSSVVARDGVDHLQLADNSISVAVAARAAATCGSAEPCVLVAGSARATNGAGGVGIDLHA